MTDNDIGHHRDKLAAVNNNSSLEDIDTETDNEDLLLGFNDLKSKVLIGWLALVEAFWFIGNSSEEPRGLPQILHPSINLCFPLVYLRRVLLFLKLAMLLGALSSKSNRTTTSYVLQCFWRARQDGAMASSASNP